MREIKILIIIILIFAAILGFKILSPSTKQIAKYSKADIIELVDKTASSNNYMCEFTSDGYPASYKFKDNVLISDYLYTSMYIDYNTGEKIMLNKETKRAIVKIDKTAPTPLLYASSIYDLLKDKDSYFKYLREEAYNSHPCIVVELRSSTAKYEVWIDSESGFVLKLVENKGFISDTTEYNLTFNALTEDVMTKPDLSKYTMKESS